MEMKKILAVGIILLLIGVSVATSINQNVVTASQDDDLVEVTTQACGIQGYRDTTVKLTREQANELDQLFVTINSKLDNATSREEYVHIIHEAVIELDRYGLLPQGMTIEQAQHVIMNGNHDHQKSVFLKQQEIFPKCINAFCLLALSTMRISIYYPLLKPVGPLSLFAVFLSSLVFYTIGARVLYYTLIALITLLILNPLKLMNLVMIEGYFTDLYSVGIKGVVESDDVFLLAGFTGLMFFTLQDKVYFLGSALAII